MVSRHLARRLLGAQQWPLGAGELPGALLLPSALHFVSWSGSMSESRSHSTVPQLDATEVARALQCQAFAAGPLRSLAEQRRAVPYHELLNLMQQQGFTPAAAEDVVGRLQRAGSILNMAGSVLLRPGEVAEALALALPSSTDDTRQRLEAAQQEFGTMEEQQAKIGRRAAWVQRGILWGGLVSQTALWGGLYWFTFHELSWDVTEPICFFASVAQIMGCYLYFMWRRREFTWENVLDREVHQYEAKQLRRMGFDKQRYQQLRDEVRRLSELLAAQEAAAGRGAMAAAAAEEGKKEA